MLATSALKSAKRSTQRPNLPETPFISPSQVAFLNSKRRLVWASRGNAQNAGSTHARCGSLPQKGAMMMMMMVVVNCTIKTRQPRAFGKRSPFLPQKGGKLLACPRPWPSGHQAAVSGLPARMPVLEPPRPVRRIPVESFVIT